MKLNIYQICFLLTLVGLTNSACKRVKYPACKGTKSQLVCTINNNAFNADSIKVLYSQSSNYIGIYARDAALKSEINIISHHALEDLDVAMFNKDSVYYAYAFGVYDGKPFTSSYGNLGIHINNNTMCGQFYIHDIGLKVNVSNGTFNQLPIQIVP